MHLQQGIKRAFRALIRILSWRPGRYLRASSDLLGWLALRALAQATQVLLMARYLGASGYGLFVTLLAISSFFVPLAGLGLHGILLRDGARDPANISKLAGNVLALWWPSTLLFSVPACFIAFWTLSESLPVALLALFLFVEIATTSLVDLAGRLEQSQQRTRAFGILQAGLPLSRVIVLLACVSVAQPDTRDWIGIYTGVSFAFAAVVLGSIASRYHPIFPAKRNWQIVREGFPFSIGGLSLRLQAELNKPMLAQLARAQAGNFSAAQRAVDLASLPLTAMQEALWPRYFASAKANLRIWEVSFFLIALSLLCGLLLTIAAPLLPVLLGTGFEDSAVLIAQLAWLPTLQVIRNLMSATIISDNRQRYLVWMYIICGLASVLFNGALIPKFGPAGAVWSTYLVEALAILVLLVQHLPHRRLKHGH